MTRDERARETELKQEAEKMQEKDITGNFVYLVCGLPSERKVVRIGRQQGAVGAG